MDFLPCLIFASRTMLILIFGFRPLSTRTGATDWASIWAVSLLGPVPIKLSGRIPREGDTRLAVEADLSQAKVDNLLPGWSKAPGEVARATFTLINKSQAMRLEDILIEAPRHFGQGDGRGRFFRRCGGCEFSRL